MDTSKIIIVIFLALFASCFVASQLFVPQILISIVKHDHPSYNDDEAQAQASRYKSFMDGAICFVNLFALPILGSLSDAYGRKRIMQITSFAQIISVFCIYLAYNLHALWLMYFLCLFSFVMAIQLCGIAYMGDISNDEKEKTKNYGVAMAAFMFGIILGALVLGIIGANGRVNAALYTLFGISAMMAVIISFLFKEDTQFYHERHQRKFSIAKGNPVSAMKTMLGKNTYVTCLVLVYAFNFMGLSDTMNTSVIYAQHRFGWGSMENGMSAAGKGLAGVFWQGFGLGLLMKKFSRQSILKWALVFSGLVFVFLGLSPNGWLFLFVSVVGGFASITLPLLQGLICAEFPKEQQGMALGGITGVSSIASLIGSLVGGNVLAWCLDEGGFTCPGTVFYISFFIYSISGLFCFFLFYKFPFSEKEEITKSSNENEEDDKEMLITSSTEKEEEEMKDLISQP